MKHLELAVQFGNPFLFEQVVEEELDPMLDPILEKDTFMQGAQRMIVLGDKTVEWDVDFRLYLTSKLANPKYTPEVMGKVMIINYSVTRSGLAAQLLIEECNVQPVASPVTVSGIFRVPNVCWFCL